MARYKVVFRSYTTTTYLVEDADNKDDAIEQAEALIEEGAEPWDFEPDDNLELQDVFAW